MSIICNCLFFTVHRKDNALCKQLCIAHKFVLSVYCRTGVTRCLKIMGGEKSKVMNRDFSACPHRNIWAEYTYTYGIYVAQLFSHILDFLLKFYLDKYGNYLLIVLPYRVHSDDDICWENEGVYTSQLLLMPVKSFLKITF